MARSDQWFKAFEDGKLSTAVVGRFVDVDAVDPIASEKAGKNVWKSVPALESKIVGNSNDISVQRVKEGRDGNKDELAGRFPGAWEHYIAGKEESGETPVVANSGTPIEELEFIPRQRVAWLRELGFSTAEQIRDMSDMIVQGLGKDGTSWRKKAKEYLEHK